MVVKEILNNQKFKLKCYFFFVKYHERNISPSPLPRIICFDLIKTYLLLVSCFAVTFTPTYSFAWLQWKKMTKHYNQYDVHTFLQYEPIVVTYNYFNKFDLFCIFHIKSAIPSWIKVKCTFRCFKGWQLHAFSP